MLVGAEQRKPSNIAIIEVANCLPFRFLNDCRELVHAAIAPRGGDTPNLLMLPLLLLAGLLVGAPRYMYGSIYDESEAVDMVSNLTRQSLKSEDVKALGFGVGIRSVGFRI